MFENYKNKIKSNKTNGNEELEELDPDEGFVIDFRDRKLRFYHGSMFELNVGDFLEPRSSRVLNGEKAVFATLFSPISLLFIPKWGNDDIEQGAYLSIFYLYPTYPYPTP